MAQINVAITQGTITVVNMDRGYSGVSGFSGRSGFSGANPGTSGTSGVSGKSGFSGRSGFSGASGVGTSGTSGRSGYSGASGGGGAWQSWTPVWTNLTVGDGTVVAKYTQTGKVVYCRLSLVFGTTTSIGGSPIEFSLPVTSVTYGGTAGVQALGPGTGYDPGNAIYPLLVVWQNTGVASIKAQGSSGSFVTQESTTSTVPFTWATADEIDLQFYYEAA